MSKFSDLKKELLKNPEVRAEHAALNKEFALVNMLIKARKEAGLTQEEVAQRMGTKQTAIARMESGRQKPSYKSIEKYAEATGHRAVVTLIPDETV